MRDLYLGCAARALPAEGQKKKGQSLEMAAQMATMKGFGAKRVVAPPEETVEKLLTELPVEKEREFDIELGLLTLNG